MVVGTRAKQTPNGDRAAANVKQGQPRDGGKRSETALVYDPALTAHKPWLAHQQKEPEVPLRVETVMQRLRSMGLTSRCDQLQGRQATREELLSVHTTEHLERLDALRDLDETTTEAHEKGYDSVYISPETRNTSMLAAGSACEATARVVSGQYRNAVAVVRPPGHHASPDKFSGFCFLNNVGIAVRQAQKAGLSRILILDWDIHHGNGTQCIFEEDPSVLFMSLHRYDNSSFYPFSEDADPQFVGKNEGAGYSVNIGWNESHLQDVDYKYAFDQVIMPIAKKFDPELVLVSAGFDGAKGDPLGICDLMPRIYHYMTTRLMELANGKVVIVLEGGYNCESTANCMAACVEALLGDRRPSYSFGRCRRGPTKKTVESVQATIDCHRPFWPDLPTADAVVELATRSLDTLDISEDAAVRSDESNGEGAKAEAKGDEEGVAEEIKKVIEGAEGCKKGSLAAGREANSPGEVTASRVDTKTANGSGEVTASRVDTKTANGSGEVTASQVDTKTANGSGEVTASQVDTKTANGSGEVTASRVDTKTANGSGEVTAIRVDTKTANGSGEVTASQVDTKTANGSGEVTPSRVDTKTANGSGEVTASQVDTKTANGSGEVTASRVDTKTANGSGEVTASRVDTKTANGSGEVTAIRVDIKTANGPGAVMAFRLGKNTASASATSTPFGENTLELTTRLLDGLTAGPGFTVIRKTDCPHALCLGEDFPDFGELKQKCERCDERIENWMCLSCHAIACGRGGQGHMLEHGRRNPDHHLVYSFADLSVWCYACDRYIITNPHLQPTLEALHLAQFGVKTF